MPFCERIGIFLEGNDDKRFFEKILESFFNSKFPNYIFHKIRHSEKADDKIIQYINSFREEECKVIFFKDYDKSPCYTEILERTIQCFEQLEQNEIFIVRKSIEGWYLAGVNETFLRDKGVNEHFEDTENISKHRFKALFPRGTTISTLMIEILEDYDIRTAIEKNSSLKRLVEKFEFDID